jgi:hypothetical protein
MVNHYKINELFDIVDALHKKQQHPLLLETN